MFSLPNISYSLMGSLIKVNGMKEISAYPLRTIAECWRNYFNNQILQVIQDLWKDYHFIGNTNIIHVFGIKPYISAVCHLERTGHDDPRRFLNSGKSLVYEPLLYCGFCNQYVVYHEHACNDDSPWDPYDGYPSDAFDTD